MNDPPPPAIRQLLEIRSALLRHDVDKAYALLYEMVDPEGTKGRPWEEWERIAENRQSQKDEHYV